MPAELVIDGLQLIKIVVPFEFELINGFIPGTLEFNIASNFDAASAFSNTFAVSNECFCCPSTTWQILRKNIIRNILLIKIAYNAPACFEVAELEFQMFCRAVNLRSCLRRTKCTIELLKLKYLLSSRNFSKRLLYAVFCFSFF